VDVNPVGKGISNTQAPIIKQIPQPTGRLEFPITKTWYLNHWLLGIIPEPVRNRFGACNLVIGDFIYNFCID